MSDELCIVVHVVLKKIFEYWKELNYELANEQACEKKRTNEQVNERTNE